MDIYSYLKKDHKKVAKLMDELLATPNPSVRENLFNEIREQLLLHAKTEQATFYKALEDRKQTGEWIEMAENEHKEIESYLKKLDAMAFNSEEWIEQFGEFKHSVTHHVEEEEGKIFEKAKMVLSDNQAEKIAEEMDELKQDPKMQKKVKAA